MLHPTIHNAASRTLQVLQKRWVLLLADSKKEHSSQSRKLYEHPLLSKYSAGTMNIKLQSLPSKSLQRKKDRQTQAIIKTNVKNTIAKNMQYA